MRECDRMGESDTDSIRSGLVGQVAEEDPAEEDEVRSIGADVRVSDEEEDGVVLAHECDERACVMKSVPRFLRGPFKNCHARRCGRSEFGR